MRVVFNRGLWFCFIEPWGFCYYTLLRQTGNKVPSLVQDVVLFQQESVVACARWVAFHTLPDTGHVIRRREVVVVHVVGLQILTQLTVTCKYFIILST